MSQIKERPILFSAPMVRAILEGRKTVTRRAVKFPFIDRAAGCELSGNEIGQEEIRNNCPYGVPGQRLWVRETHSFVPDPEEPAGYSQVLYAADGQRYGKNRPSIHMFRADSRILLEITDVRVERLQDGEGETAFESRYIAEGINRIHQGDGDYAFHPFKSEPGPGNWTDPFDAWRELWVRINGAESWNSNPWVWVVEFKRVTP